MSEAPKSEPKNGTKTDSKNDADHGVTKRDVPGRRLSRKCWMYSGVSFRPGWHPSTTQPIAGPWLSPQVVTRNRWPKVLCDMPAV